MNRARFLYLDLLRIIASFFVVLWHTDGNLYTNYSEVSISWLWAVLNRSIFSSAVIIFFMISGVTLTRKKYQYKKLLKNVIKFATIIMINSIIYYLLFPERYSFTFAQLFIEIWEEPINIVNWYLYTMIGIYLMMPIIYNMLKSIKRLDAIFLTCLYFVFSNYGLFHIISLGTGYELTSYFNLSFFVNNIAYLMIGYFVFEYLIGDKKYEYNRNRIALISFVILVLWSGCTVVYSIYHMEVYNSNILLQFNIVPAICLFVLAEWLCSSVKKYKFYIVLSTIVGFVAPLTLWIYVIHNIVKELLQPYLYILSDIPLVFQRIIYAIVVYVISFILSFLLDRTLVITKKVSERKKTF